MPGTLLYDTNLDATKKQAAKEITADHKEGADAPLSRLLLQFPHLPSEEKRLAGLPDSLSNELLKEQKALVGAVGEIHDELRSISTALQKLVEVVEMKFQPRINEENKPASSSEILDGFFTDLLNAE